MKENTFCGNNLTLPATQYTGIQEKQSRTLIEDFIENKEEIVNAINDKGGEAEITDSMSKLANKINQLVPAEPVFETSGNISPYWTDLLEKIGRHYREDRKHCWTFSFSNQAQQAELKGGDYYICSDGFETDKSQTHTFGENPDTDKDDHWIIIYTENPTYTFEAELAPHIIGAAFYNTTGENVLFYGTKISFIIHEGETTKKNFTLPSYYANSTGLTNYNIPQNIEEVSIGNDAFNLCRGLRDIRFPRNVKNITFGSNACTYNAAFPVLNNTTYPNLDNITIDAKAFNYIETCGDILIESAKTINISGGGSLAYNKGRSLTLKSKSIKINNPSLTTGSDIQELYILAEESLSIANANVFNSEYMNKIYLQKPSVNLITNTSNFNSFKGTIIELGQKWNYSINLTTAVNQSIESMIQNCEALEDRTDKTALTYTIGANKLAALTEARPDIIELVQSKNWNIV